MCPKPNFSSASRSCSGIFPRLTQWLLPLSSCSGNSKILLGCLFSVITHPGHWIILLGLPLRISRIWSLLRFLTAIPRSQFLLSPTEGTPVVSRWSPCCHHCSPWSVLKRAARVILSKCESDQPTLLLKILQLIHITLRVKAEVLTHEVAPVTSQTLPFPISLSLPVFHSTRVASLLLLDVPGVPLP